MGKLREYGKVEKDRDFDISVRGKNRKFFDIRQWDTRLELVDALQRYTNRRFFFFEWEKFNARSSFYFWKKDIFYPPNELLDPWFFLCLFHEVAHFPFSGKEGEVSNEQEARLKAMTFINLFKTDYRVCFLAWFKNHQEVYAYTREFIKTYQK